MTGVSTTAATASDQAGLREAMETQGSQGLEPPPELYVDRAYVTGGGLVEAEAQGGAGGPDPAVAAARKRGFFSAIEF